MTNQVLKPCPFCGFKARLYQSDMWEIFCENDNCVMIGSFKTEKEAITAWNTRA